MHRDRIEKIRDNLRDNVPDDRFDLSTWAGDEEKPWLGNSDLSCGTTACVLGWATTIPEFRALGLRLEKYSSNSKIGFLVFEGEHHFNAAAKFFDFSVKEAEYLFGPDSYELGKATTRSEAIERINDFLINGMPLEDDDDDDDEEYVEDEDEYGDSLEDEDEDDGSE